MAEYLYGVSDHHVMLYEKKAEECRKQAENSLSSFDRAAWLRLAEDWTQMAQKIARRLKEKDGPA